ncbi:hypothetical protein ACP70R_020684 [Stipagrostis hirtigluma subsp. patula]
MDNVLIDRSASGFDFLRWTAAGDGCRSLAVSLPPPRSMHSSFVYGSPLPPLQYAPYLHSSLSLPPLPSRRPPLLPLPPPAAVAKYATAPPPPASAGKGKAAPAAGMTAAAPRRTDLGEFKRKKPRAPRAGDEPPRAQRRKPLERAAPLPPAPAVDEALDDLEREVAMGFIGDLLHALAPPPSSLPLPTFSLVRAAAAKAAAAPCAV